MTAFTGEVHPYAAAYPMLGAEDLDRLAESIKADGLLSPIVLTPSGALLDGRNRLAACDRAGVEPAFVMHTGDPIAYVVAANVHRRHLTTGQRAAAVAIGLAEQGKRRDGRWARGSVPTDPATSGSGSRDWPKRMAEAGAVWDVDPDLLARVLTGSISLDAAHTEAASIVKRAAVEDEQITTLRDNAPDLADLVADGMALDEAWAAYKERTKEDRAKAEALAAAIEQYNVALARGLTIFADLTAGDDGRVVRTVVEFDAAPTILRRDGLTAELIDRAIDGLSLLRKALPW